MYSFAYFCIIVDYYGGLLHYTLEQQIFQEFIEGVKHDKSLAEKLNNDQVVLFMHLLGLDTNGHANKPYSKYVS